MDRLLSSLPHFDGSFRRHLASGLIMYGVILAILVSKNVITSQSTGVNLATVLDVASGGAFLLFIAIVLFATGVIVEAAGIFILLITFIAFKAYFYLALKFNGIVVSKRKDPFFDKNSILRTLSDHGKEKFLSMPETLQDGAGNPLHWRFDPAWQFILFALPEQARPWLRSEQNRVQMLLSVASALLLGSSSGQALIIFATSAESSLGSMLPLYITILISIVILVGVYISRTRDNVRRGLEYLAAIEDRES